MSNINLNLNTQSMLGRPLKNSRSHSQTESDDLGQALDNLASAVSAAQEVIYTAQQSEPDNQFVTITVHHLDEEGFEAAPDVYKEVARGTVFCYSVPRIDGFTPKTDDIYLSITEETEPHLEYYVTYVEDKRFLTRFRRGYYNDSIKSAATYIAVVALVVALLRSPNWSLFNHNDHSTPNGNPFMVTSVQDDPDDDEGMVQNVTSPDGYKDPSGDRITANDTGNQATPDGDHDSTGTGVKDPETDPYLPPMSNTDGDTTSTSNWSTPMRDKYVLTVKYVDEQGVTLVPSAIANIPAGTYYQIQSPNIAGYSPDKTVVSGVMGQQDTVIAVCYHRVAPAG